MLDAPRLFLLGAMTTVVACNADAPPDTLDGGLSGTGALDESGTSAAAGESSGSETATPTAEGGSSGNADGESGATEDTGTSESDTAGDTGAPMGCGDGVLDPTEQCDDGNRDDGDGCDADCTAPAGTLLCQIEDAPDGARLGGYGVVVDAESNVYVSGRLAEGGQGTAFVRRYNAACELQWEATLDEVSEAGPLVDIGIGPDGHPVIAGRHWVDDPGYNAGFVAKFDDEGNLSWSDSGNVDATLDNDLWAGVAVGSDNAVVVCGTAAQAVDATLGWVRKLEPTGVALWTWTADAAGDPLDARSTLDCDVGADGEIALAGFVDGAGAEPWTARLSASGDTVWTVYDSVEFQGGFLDTLVLTPDGSSYAAGFFQPAVSMYSTLLEHRDDDGGLIASQMYPNVDAQDRTHDMTLHQDGSLTLVGHVPTAAGASGHIRRVTGDGQPLWDEVADVPKGLSQQWYGADEDPASGAVFVVGTLSVSDNQTEALWLRKYAP